MTKLITLETAMSASSNRDELQEMINRGVGVVAGAGLGAPGGPPAAGRPMRPVDRRVDARRARLSTEIDYGDFCIQRTDPRRRERVSGERIGDTMDAVVAALRREQILVTRISPAKAKAGAAPKARKLKAKKASARRTSRSSRGSSR